MPVRKKNAYLNIRVKKDTRNKLLKLADEAEMYPSEFARLALEEYIKKVEGERGEN